MLVVCRISPSDQGANGKGLARGLHSRCLQPVAGGCSNSVSTLHQGGLGVFQVAANCQRQVPALWRFNIPSSGNGLNGAESLRQTLRIIALSNREMQSSPWIDCERGAAAVKQCEQDAGMKSQISRPPQTQTSSHLGRTAGPSGIQSSRAARHPAQPPHAPPMGQGFIPSPWALGELGLVEGLREGVPSHRVSRAEHGHSTSKSGFQGSLQPYRFIRPGGLLLIALRLRIWKVDPDSCVPSYLLRSRSRIVFRLSFAFPFRRRSNKQSTIIS